MSETEVVTGDIHRGAENINETVKDDGLDRKTLFVRGIPFDATSDELSEYFSQFVPVKHAVIVNDNEQKSRGFGFVSFTLEEDTLAALLGAKKTKFKGRMLRVDMAKRRDRKDTKDSQTAHTKPDKQIVEKRRARLIVRNLPWSCKKPEQLKNLFSKYGAVFDAYIPKKKNGQMLGFAFVIMKKKAAAEKAVKESSGLKIDGREVAVDLAVEKSKWEEVRANEEEEEEEEDDDDDEEDEDEDEDEEEEGDDKDDNEDEDADEDVEMKDNKETDSNSDSESEDNDDFDDLNELKDEEVEEETPAEEPVKVKQNKQESYSVFVRNIPYDTTAEALKEHFQKFGAVKYALPVKDRLTGLAKGSAFVAFFKEDAYSKCITNAPTIEATTLLIADDVSPDYVFEGRVLNITSAVDRKSADILATKNADKRKEAAGKEVHPRDKRFTYLLNEGRITENSKLAQFISKTDMELRDKSYKLRVQQLNKNPSLHLSLTRLAIRNLPRAMNSKSLKALGRKAIVQFATEVKNGERQPLSKEEINRSVKLKAENKELEETKAKKSKHAGVVKQAKVVMEVKGTGDIGRSRGYGFIEFRDHKSALMGLRWLNAHEVTPEEILEGLTEEEKKIADLKGINKRRLIAEFAIENAQVVKRRNDKVYQARVHRERHQNGEDQGSQAYKPRKRSASSANHEDESRKTKSHKPNRKGNMNKGPRTADTENGKNGSDSKSGQSDDIKRLIGMKRKRRKNKK